MTPRPDVRALLDRYALYVGLAPEAGPSGVCFAYYREMPGVIAQADEIPAALVELDAILLQLAERVARDGGHLPDAGDFEWEAELAAEGLPDFTKPDFGLRDSGAYGAFLAGAAEGPDGDSQGLELTDPPDLEWPYRDGPPDEESSDLGA
jgi:hypothetical protein